VKQWILRWSCQSSLDTQRRWRSVDSSNNRSVKRAISIEDKSTLILVVAISDAHACAISCPASVQTVRKQPEQPLQADGMATSPRQNPAKPSPAEPLPSQQPQQQPTGRHSPSASGAGGQEADTGLDAATAPPTRSGFCLVATHACLPLHNNNASAWCGDRRGLSALGTSMRQTRLQALATRQRSGGKPEARYGQQVLHWHGNCHLQHFLNNMRWRKENVLPLVYNTAGL
jgi:hypothetical protein